MASKTAIVEIIGHDFTSSPRVSGTAADYNVDTHHLTCGATSSLNNPEYHFVYLQSNTSASKIDGGYYVSLSSIYSALGISSSDVTGVVLSASVRTAYINSTSPTCGYAIYHSGLYPFSSAKLQIYTGGDNFEEVDIPNTGSAKSAALEVTEFNLNAVVDVIFERSGSGNPTSDGIKITSFYAEVTYNEPECSPYVSSAQYYTGDDWVDIPRSGTSTDSTNTGDVMLYGAYGYSGSCSSVSGGWLVSKDNGRTYYYLPNSDSPDYFNYKWFGLDQSTLKFKYRASASSGEYAESGVVTVTRKAWASPNWSISQTCHSVTGEISFEQYGPGSGFTPKFAIKKTSESSYGDEQSSFSFNNLDPNTSYTVRVTYYGTGHEYLPTVFTTGTQYTTTFTTLSARIEEAAVDQDNITCNSIKVKYSDTDTCGNAVSGQYSTDQTNWSNIPSNKTITGLSPNTRYYFRVHSSDVSWVSFGPATTKTARITVEIPEDERYCTAFSFTASHTCGYTMSYYLYDGDTLVTSGTTSSSGNTITGRIPNHTYKLKITANSTDDYETNISTKPVGLTLLVTDNIEGTTTEGDGKEVTVAYPRTLQVTSTSNCYQTPVYQWSEDGASWNTFTTRRVDIYKPYDGTTYLHRYHIRASLTIQGTTYYSTQIWDVQPPVINLSVTGTYSGAPTKTVNNGDTVNVFDTAAGGGYHFRLNYSSSWNGNTIVTADRYIKITNPNGTSSEISGSMGYNLSSSDSRPIQYDTSYTGVKYSYNPITLTYKYGSTTIAENTASLYILPIVFSSTDGYITATASSFGTKRVYGEDSEEGEIEGISGERISFNAGGFGTANFEYTWIAQVAELGTTNWTNLVDRSDGIDSAVPGDSSRRTLIAINTEKKFSYLFSVTATDDIGKQYSSGGQQRLTAYFVVGVGIVAEVTLLPDPAVGAKNDTEFIANASKSFVQGYEYRLEHSWDIKKNNVSVKDKAVVVSGDWDEDNLTIQLTEIGTYILTDTISGEYKDGETWKDIPSTTTWGTYDNEGRIVIKEIVNTGISDFSRFSLVVSNSSKCFVASRNKAPYFTELKFGKYLSNIGVLTCKIIGINKVLNDEGVSVEDLLMEPGATVCLLDRMNPVWIGVLSETSEQDTNTYDKSPLVKIYNITAYESTKKLAIDFLPNTDKGLTSGTITDIAKKIIPVENQGLIGNSKVNYGISLANTSRLVALDQLYGQAGWRYRCRPNTKVYWKEITSGDYTISSADLIEGTSCESGDVFIFYNNGVYGCGIVEEYETLPQGSYPSFKTTYRVGNSLPTSCYVTVLKSFLIDFRASYYQTYDTRTWTVNYDATSVDANQNIRDKFGTAIVYGVGYSGESIASKMEAWMTINKDYTIDNSMRITRSYDSEVDTVVKIDEVEYIGATYCRYAITFNGWSFPDIVNLTRLSQPTSQGGMNVKPRVYYVNINKELHYMELDYPLPNEGIYSLPENPRRYYDQANNKKCTYTIAVLKGQPVSGDGATLQTSVIDSLVQLSNVIFPVFAVDNIVGLPAVDEDIYVGDMTCKLTYVDSNYSEVKVDYYAPVTNWEQGGIPHGHLTDVLVMPAITAGDNTYKPGSPMPDSPASKYPDVSFTSQGPEGYSIMEMERLACRYMQYGSNYNAQGKCNIGAVFFYRNDYEIGAVRLPMVGDRIALKKVLEDGTEYVSQYELQRYEFDMDNYAVTIVFGMPIINVGDFIYNMQANSGLSIIPADS